MPSRVKMRPTLPNLGNRVLIINLITPIIIVAQLANASSSSSWLVYPSWKSLPSPSVGSHRSGRVTSDFASVDSSGPQVASSFSALPSFASSNDDESVSTWTLEINEVLPNTAAASSLAGNPSSVIKTKKKFFMKENTELLSSQFRITKQMKGALKDDSVGVLGVSSSYQGQAKPQHIRKCRHFMGHGDGGASSTEDVAAVTSCPNGKTTGVLVSGGRYYMIYPAEDEGGTKDGRVGPSSSMTPRRQGRRAGEDPDVPATDKDELNSITDDVSPHLLVLHEDNRGGRTSLCGLKAAGKNHNMTSSSATKEKPIDTSKFSWPGLGNSRTTDEKYVLELAVFTDADFIKYIESRFPGDPLPHAVDVVLSFVNGVQALYDDRHLQPPLTLTVVQLDILSSDSAQLNKRDNNNNKKASETEENNRSGRKMPGGEELDSTVDMDEPFVADDDIMKYLKNFCSWAAKRNPAAGKESFLLNNDVESQSTLWDHAMLISGKDLSIDGDNAVMGLAWVDGMCTLEESCSVNEGRSFRSVFVMAHELAHNFGVSHDGDKGAEDCKDGDYLMSESDGPGKTTWSKCSKSVLAAGLRKAQCLRETSGSKEEKPALSSVLLQQDTSADPIKTKVFSPDEQCAYAHGSTFSAVPDQDDMCYDLYCTNGAKILRSHPAVEGTVCGMGKVCSKGKCTEFAEPKPQNSVLDEGPIINPWKNLVRTSVWGKLAATVTQKTNQDASKEEMAGSGNKVPPGIGRATSEESHEMSHRSMSAAKSPLLMPSDMSNLVVPMSAVEWRVRKGPCSVSCGGGVRTVEATCVVTGEEEAGIFKGSKKEAVPQVDPSLCLDVTPPPVHGPTETCNPQPCPKGDWTLRPWGQCLPAGQDDLQATSIFSKKNCGSVGIQYRSVVCKAKLLKPNYRNRNLLFLKIFSKEILMSKLSFVLKDSECPSPKPADERYCEVQCFNGGLLGVMAKNPVVSSIQKAVGGFVDLFKPKTAEDQSIFVG